MNDDDIAAFQRRILDWYDAHRRDLPWRGETDPYRVLVSEVMLQQTTVGRIIQKYEQFLAHFPTVAALAAAPTADVLRAWEGLGYNRRAVNLKRAAEAIVRDHGGRVPEAIADLERLPGIGRYTARAVASFAYGVDVAVVDTNVRRVLAGFAGRELTERETEELAARLLPAGRASDWNQALMDYGALVHKARPKRKAKSEGPFVTTNRYWRGRIVDALRRSPGLTLDRLVEVLPREHRDEARVRGLVRALHEEGLVSYDVEEDTVRLPE